MVNERGVGIRSIGYERAGTILLVGASIIVGLSIVLDGPAAKVLNGIGGLAWFAAAALLVAAALRSSRFVPLWLAAVVLTSIVAFVVRPSDLLLASIGFGIAGMIIVWLSPTHDLLWAKSMVAMYLPFHIGAAIAKVIIRSIVGIEASVRTEPPPTAALVPLVMVLAALGGGTIARHLARRRSGLRQRLPAAP